METITEEEFKKLCNDIYRDRYEYYPLNPNVGHREVLLWMLLGSLVSLLSVPILEQPSVYNGGSDPYRNAIIELLRERTLPVFDPGKHLTELSEKIYAEK